MKPVFIVSLGLSAIAVGFGLFLGLREGPSESDVILAGARIYGVETGGPATDCVGVPGRDAVWIEVRCGESGALRTYLFDRRGVQIVREESGT